MKALYVTADDSLLPGAENNGHYVGNMFNAIFAGLTRHQLEPLTLYKSISLGVQRIAYGLSNQHIVASLDPGVRRHRARAIEHLFRETRSDILVSNIPSALSDIDTSIPYIIYTDTTYTGMRDLGEYTAKWPKRFLNYAIEMDCGAVNGAQLVVYHSQWASQMAVKDYGLSADKVAVVLPGANLPWITEDHISITKEPSQLCRLLFFGRDWKRKGGPKAVEIVRQLRLAGIDAVLTICGPAALPKELERQDWVRLSPRIDKSTPTGFERVRRLFLDSDYLILPTLADTSAGAIREACAFGVPSISTDIAGLPEMVVNGLEGMLFSRSTSPQETAERVASNFLDESERVGMRRAARTAYEQRLNWKIASDQMRSVLTERYILRG